MEKDFFGNELIIGETYGYYNENNGVINAVIGKLVGIENGRAKIKSEKEATTHSVLENHFRESNGRIRTTKLNKLFKKENADI